MKKPLALLACTGLATVVAIIALDHRTPALPTPPQPANFQATATPRPASDVATANQTTPRHTTSGMGQLENRRQPRLLDGERRFARTDLAKVMPSVTAPVADWRTFAPAKLTVVPLDGMPLEFTARSVTNDGRRTTWVGTNPTDGATLVAVATETLWDAIITIPGADEYNIKVTPEMVRTFETSSVGAVCGSPILEADALVRAAKEALDTSSTQLATGAAITLYTSDLLVLYDEGTRTDWGSAAETENRIAAVVAAGNTYLTDSKVDNFQWRLVGTKETPAYTGTNSLEDDLDNLADPRTTLGRFARDQRTIFGADQVMFIVSGDKDYAGIAFIPGYLSVVSHPGTAATAAHELAHNLGCNHDRETAEAADNDGHYYYGHRFTYNSKDVGTLMSYADYYIPYFSNPSVTYEGIATGVESGQPKAADNARWLREHAENISTLMATKQVELPVITTQPSAVTITAGQSFSLRVTATGNELTYQWTKGGVNIAGATSATYSKASATTADSGSYAVTVTNSAGSVTSNAVAVTVNAAPVTTTPSSSGGSSGGGGGSFGLLGAAAFLALLGAGRANRPR